MSRLFYYTIFLLANLVGCSFATSIYRCTGSDGIPVFSQVACSPDATVVTPSVESSPAVVPDSAGLRDSERAWLKQWEKQRRSRILRGAGVNRSKQYRQSTGSEQRCLGKRQQLARISARLRRGYKPSQGEKLRRRKGEYQDYLNAFCD